MKGVIISLTLNSSGWACNGRCHYFINIEFLHVHKKGNRLLSKVATYVVFMEFL